LGGKHKDLSLDQVGEYAISESDLVSVQEYLRELFEPFQPTDAHQLLPSFRWAGLATTNYDRLIERAYEKPDAAQKPVPFIENGDRVDELMRDPKSVKLLKLHGCITRTANADCPLILTPDQYIQHRSGRSRIFDQLRDWAYERPIIFVGHRLQDADIRAILLELAQLGDKRPRFYVVAPTIDQIQERIWEAKKVMALKGSFGDLMETLDKLIDSPFRGIVLSREPDALPISEHFSRNDVVLSPACTQFLTLDVDYVKGISSTETVAARDFFKGVSKGFSAIEQDLDVRRHLGDTILADNFLIDEAQHSDKLEMIVIKAHAGAGKSVLLRRIAWDATYDYDCICLFVRSYGVISAAPLQELLGVCSQRIYLFVDDAADRVRELRALARNIGPEGKRLTVVMAERINEWNTSCAALSSLLNNAYELRYLSSKEIEGLLDKLEHHRALGTLERFDRAHRSLQFSEVAGRQLLVALHEATLGVPFEEIIQDEFNHIEPYEARMIYLTICVLNRLNVSVRAGLVSRIHGIGFDEFKARLFAPLEHIVQTEEDPVIRDHLYRARHPHIAEIVFQRVLNTQEARLSAYLGFLANMNIDYAVDLKAFRQLLRARSLMDQFTDAAIIERIYEAAVDSVGEDAYLLQQMAIHEMNKPQPDHDRCSNLLDQASKMAPHDVSIKHSTAEHKLRCAENARTSLEQQALLRQASDIASSLRFGDDSYPYHTMAKIGLKRLQLLVQSQEEITVPALEATVKEAEKSLSEGLQQYPGDPYLLEAESRLAEFLADSKRVLDALRRAFDANTKSIFIATRLAQCYKSQENLPAALAVIKQALGSNAGDKKLNYIYSKLLLDTGGTPDELLYHLRRSFVPGDNNHDAQLLYGRQLFIGGMRSESKQVFADLGKARIPAEARDRILYPLGQHFHGQVSRLEAVYCFIARDGMNDWIFATRASVGEAIWKSLTMSFRLSFKIGFTFKGAQAFDVAAEAGVTAS
jgi:hypothetical protein